MLAGAGWASGPVRIAVTRRMRRRGLTPEPAGCGLLLRTRSVHGFGMRVPLHVAGLSPVGTVLAVGTLRPGRLWSRRRVAWVLELPAERLPPPVGARLHVHRVVLPRVTPWPES